MDCQMPKEAEVSIRRVSKNEFMVSCTSGSFLQFMKDIGDGVETRRANPPTAVFPQKSMPMVMRFMEDHHKSKVEPFLKVTISQDDLKNIHDIYTNARNRKSALQKIRDEHNAGTLQFDYELKGRYAPFKHQIMMYNVCTKMDVCALFSDMGTGKSGPMIWSIDKRIQDKQVSKALIVTLNSLTRNIVKEASIQAPHVKCVVLRGGKKRCTSILNKSFKVKHKNIDYDIFVVNYESLFSLQEILKDRFDMVIFDESHKLANFTSRTTKTALKLFDYTKYKIISTGTPFSNKLWSFFMQFRILSADTLPVADFYAFMGRYFQQSAFNRYVYTAHPGTEAMIKNTIEQVSVSFKRQDCLDLPPLSYKLFTFDMTKEQIDDYLKLQKDMIVGLDCLKCNKLNNVPKLGEPSPCEMCEKSLLLENILTLGMKLDQIVNGYMYGNVETKNVITYPKNPKIEALFEVMEAISIDDKIVIWCPYVPMLKQIEARLIKEKETYIRAYENDDVFAQAEKFNASPGVRVFLVSQRKGGVGLNLTSANYEIFAANDFSFVLRDQAEARLHRPGQTKNVCVVDIVCPSTADEAIYDALHNKKEMAASLLANLRVMSAKHAERKDITEESEIGPEEDGLLSVNDNTGSDDDQVDS